MADLSVIESVKVRVTETNNSVAIPDKYRYFQELWIQVRIIQRDESTGTIRLLNPYPRLWTGYYYLLSENCIFKHGTIEFQNQEIYRAINFTWNTEVAVNENAYNLSTPEFPPDIDNVDEAAESDLWLGTSDKKNIYLPLQLPIDKVVFSVPRLCELDVLISGRKFSPISAFGGDNDIDLYKDEDNDGKPDLLIATPANPSAFPPMDVNAVVSDFDQIARSKGYISASECQQQAGQSLIDLVNNSMVDYGKLLSELLSGGAILQADIDAIKASNPNISDKDLIIQLINQGKITPTEFQRAYDIAYAKTYIAPAGKKSGWFCLTTNRRADCSFSYTLYFIVGTPNTYITALRYVDNSTSIPVIPWGSVTSDSPALLFPKALFAGNQDSICGDPRDLWIFSSGVAQGYLFYQMRSQGTPRVFFRIEP